MDTLNPLIPQPVLIPVTMSSQVEFLALIVSNNFPVFYVLLYFPGQSVS